jgi:MoxR-like ATPase
MEDTTMNIDEKTLTDMIDKVKACEAEIGKGIIGQRDIIRQVLLAILADGNVLLEGVPGLGKTELVKAFSKVMQTSFSRIQFTPDLMPADVTGTNLIIKENGNNVFKFEKGPVFANIVLADEINRATPKTQSALLEAMQEKTVTVGKNTYDMPQPFMVLATQNPIENEGTYPLPEAQLDRFLFKLLVEFPSKDELKQIVNITVGNTKAELAPVVTGEDIINIRKVIREMPVADAVMDYAMSIVVATHGEQPEAPEVSKKYIANGASPRAAQAIVKTARARAFVEGRYNVSFEDIQFVAYPALRHRIALNFEAVSEGITADNVIKQIIDSIATI